MAYVLLFAESDNTTINYFSNIINPYIIILFLITSIIIFLIWFYRGIVFLLSLRDRDTRKRLKKQIKKAIPTFLFYLVISIGLRIILKGSRALTLPGLITIIGLDIIFTIIDQQNKELDE